MRVFLVVMAWTLGILAVLALIGFVLWSMYGREFVSAFNTSTEEGARIGSTTNDAVCYEKTVERLKGCESLKCTMEAKVFASNCFGTVRVRTDLCEGIPKVFNLIEYAVWQEETCEKISPDNEHCGKVLQNVAKYCTLKRD
mgnify:CR=1 FL=1